MHPYFREQEPAKTISQPANPASLLWFVLLHVPLALLLQLSPLFATLHALISIAAGLFFLARDKHPYRVIYATAYITGIELVWRITGASIFWETGKYAVSLLLLLAILKYGIRIKKARWPIVYFVLLLPSIMLLPSFDREAISFNLAGPFALAVAVIFFSMIKINRQQLKNILIALLAPAVSLGIIAISGIVSQDQLVFSQDSNFQTSADFGPNQVSSILALGAMAAFYYGILIQRSFYRVVFILISLWLLAQSTLTFSRGGLYTIAGALFISGLYLVRDKRTRVVFILASLIVGLLGYYLALPYLDAFTGDALSKRLRDTEATGRIEIMQADWMVFKMFPLFGVGPNQSKPFHALTFRSSSAHVEYTRLLSEHGSFGLLALTILVIATIQRVRSKSPPISKAFALGFTVWALLYMFHASTRLVAPSFLFGLGSAFFIIQDEKFN